VLTDGPVAELAVEADDESLLVGGEVAALDVGAEVVDPAEAAALAAAEQAGKAWQRAPVGVAVLPDVGHQALVLLGAPRAPPQPLLLAARRPPHRPPGQAATRRSIGGPSASGWLAPRVLGAAPGPPSC
jgi:pyruvate/2-oxoglutarate dehydrogenase complex dihydrolipoamide acyltransferase (E2) component